MGPAGRPVQRQRIKDVHGDETTQPPDGEPCVRCTNPTRIGHWTAPAGVVTLVTLRDAGHAPAQTTMIRQPIRGGGCT
jgi:hypothetical protein